MLVRDANELEYLLDMAGLPWTKDSNDHWTVLSADNLNHEDVRFRIEDNQVRDAGYSPRWFSLVLQALTATKAQEVRYGRIAPHLNGLGVSEPVAEANGPEEVSAAGTPAPVGA